jgi:hypothetical protein
MYKKNIIIFALIFLIIIAGIGILFWSDYFSLFKDQEEKNPSLIKTRYDNKIVYNSDADLRECKKDCSEREGFFDDCGSICPPDAEICAEVCAKVCILEPDDKKDGFSDNLLNYDNKELGFSLKYPENAEVKKETENRIEFLWLGDNQKTGTEITDGARILVSKLDLPPRTSLKDHLQEKIDNQEPVIEGILSGIELENQYDYATYTYAISSLGEYKHLVAPINSQKYFDISVFISHDYYQGFINELLASFKITDSEKFSTQKEEKIVVDKPLLAQSITSPFKIEGQAVGNWFFEANFRIILVDWDGKIIAESIATAKDDWMTGEMVPFEADLEFEKPKNLYSLKATLIFEKSNPSGLPENDEALEYFVYFD